MRSGSGGMAEVWEIRSVKYCQKETPSFRQVRFKLMKVSRQRCPRSLRVPPLTLRFLTGSRRSRSLPLVCSAMSGRSSTNSNSALLRWIRLSVWFRVSKLVWVVKRASKRASRSIFFSGKGCAFDETWRAEGEVEEPAIAGRRPGEAGDASRRIVIVGAVSHRIGVRRGGRRTNRGVITCRVMRVHFGDTMAEMHHEHSDTPAEST